ncbi:MAG: thioredoxin family protein [Acidimicrobiia bacterium]
MDEAGESPTPVESSPRSRRGYLIVAIVLAAGAVAAVFIASTADPRDLAPRADVANLPIGPNAPDLVGEKGWINSDPLSAADLRDRVVVYDFWTYSCVNCVRTLPHLRAWHDRYAAEGLVIVGVHSPEFEFEKDHDNVRDAVTRLKVDYPVALDDDMAIWRQFENQYWPAKYIADGKGRLRYLHIGEGSYGETEAVIRKLLGVPKSAPRARAVDEKAVAPPEEMILLTPELYLGLLRGQAAQPGTVTYPADPAPANPAETRLEGTWSARGEYVTAEESGAAIVLGYQAREVNLVLASESGDPIDVIVEIDGRPLRPSERTTQTMVDAEGNTFVRVSASGLYRLVLTRSFEQHTIRLTTRGPGLEAFAFTFGA